MHINDQIGDPMVAIPFGYKRESEAFNEIKRWVDNNDEIADELVDRHIAKIPNREEREEAEGLVHTHKHLRDKKRFANTVNNMQLMERVSGIISRNPERYWNETLGEEVMKELKAELDRTKTDLPIPAVGEGEGVGGLYGRGVCSPNERLRLAALETEELNKSIVVNNVIDHQVVEEELDRARRHKAYQPVDVPIEYFDGEKMTQGALTLANPKYKKLPSLDNTTTFGELEIKHLTKFLNDVTREIFPNAFTAPPFRKSDINDLVYRLNNGYDLEAIFDNYSDLALEGYVAESVDLAGKENDTIIASNALIPKHDRDIATETQSELIRLLNSYPYSNVLSRTANIAETLFKRYGKPTIEEHAITHWFLQFQHTLLGSHKKPHTTNKTLRGFKTPYTETAYKSLYDVYEYLIWLDDNRYDQDEIAVVEPALETKTRPLRDPQIGKYQLPANHGDNYITMVYKMETLGELYRLNATESMPLVDLIVFFLNNFNLQRGTMWINDDLADDLFQLYLEDPLTTISGNEGLTFDRFFANVLIILNVVKKDIGACLEVVSGFTSRWSANYEIKKARLTNAGLLMLTIKKVSKLPDVGVF